MADDDHHEQSLQGVHIHFIGIGGSGMCGLAQIALQSGAFVTGSDRAVSPDTRHLESLGIHIGYRQEDGEIPPETQWVICTAAIAVNNGELITAKNRGLKILKYSQMLGRVMELKTGIAIAGTHGKSTTTAMLACILAAAGMDPSFVVGAQIPQLNGSSHGGAGEHFVVEACEFDRSFLNLRPHIAAVLNIEPDHLDYYRDLDDITEAFRQFTAQVHPEGLVVIAADSAACGRAVSSCRASVLTYGIDRAADIQATNLQLVDGCFEFDVRVRGAACGRLALRVPGRHNVGNALVAAAIGAHVGAGWPEIYKGLQTFGGAKRRSELIRNSGGIVLVDDYAHHPTEITATLAALRMRWNPKRLICVFQPHQHSRTRCFMDEFSASFSDADIVIVPDIHFARDTEADRTGVKANTLVEKMCAHGVQARYIPELGQVGEYLLQIARAGDLIVSMGAGNVWKVTHELAKRI